MNSRRSRQYVIAAVVVAGLITALALLTSGRGKPNDEVLKQPRATITVTRPPIAPSSTVPAEVPVGSTDLPLDVPAWATSGRLQIGRRSADVSPRSVDAFVVARGGVYFVDGSELWFTDLRTVRATGLTSVVGLAIDAGRRQVRVTVTGRDGPTSHTFDTRVGGLVDGLDQAAFPPLERQGRWVQVSLSGSRVDLTPAADDALLDASLGPGRYGVLGIEKRALQPFDTATGRLVPLRPAVEEFRLGGWTGRNRFYGVTYVRGTPDAVIECSLGRRRCTTLGVVPDGLPVVFDTGSLAIGSR